MKKKVKKDLLISVPHAMHARNLFCSSFDFKNTTIILGNFTDKVRKSLERKNSTKIKNFNNIHFFQSKIISFYSLLIDYHKINNNNVFINLLKRNYDKCDLSFKKTFKHKMINKYNSIFFFIMKIFFVKEILKLFLIISSFFIYLPIIIKHRPKKVLFMCSNSFIDKGLILLKNIFKFKVYGLISSWDHLSTKRFLDINSFDKVFIWNKYFKKELKNIYNFNLKRSHVIGIPYYDFKRKIYTKKNYITFFMPNPSMMDEKTQFEVINFLEKYCNQNNFSLYVKPHPGINYVNFANIKNKKINLIIPKEISMNLNKTIKSNKFFDYELDKIIQQSKIVINFHSTTSLDSIFHLTPVINLSLNKKDKWLYQIPYYKFILDYNAISLASSLTELKRLLDLYLRKKDFNKINIVDLKKDYFGNFNPNSGKLMSEIILKD